MNGNKITAALAASFVGLAASFVGLAPSPAFAADPLGKWLTAEANATVNISKCGGALCGTIVALKEPNDSAGKPKTDKKNPDAARRARPLVGTQIVFDMKPTAADKWAGQVYNAEDGKTYAGYITLVGSAELKLQGCALGGLVCKTQTWTRTH